MKRRWSVGRIVSVIGILILCMGLLLNGFELISNTIFRVIVLVGIIVNLVALCIILKKEEF
jgi:hypothetical protein